MHGLNKNQSSLLGQLFTSLTPSSGSPQIRLWLALLPDAPGNLESFVPPLGSGFVQTYMKRCKWDCIMTNAGQLPCEIQVTKLRCRKDVPNNSVWGSDIIGALINIASQNTGTSNIMQLNYISWTVGETFQKFFKILTSRRFILRPGRQFKTAASHKYPSRPLTHQSDAQSAAWHYRRGNMLTLIHATGLPYSGSDGTTPVLGNVKLAYMIHRYYSYYNMDDVVADATFTSITPVRPVPIQTTITQNEQPYITISGGSNPEAVPVLNV